MKVYIKLVILSVFCLIAIVSCSPSSSSGIVENSARNADKRENSYTENISNFFSSVSEDSELSPEEFMKWTLENQSLIRNKSVGDFQFQLKYLPSEEVTLRELSGQKIEKENYEQTLKEFSDHDYFRFTILNNYNNEFLKSGIRSHEEYEDRIKYYSFMFQEDISMISAGDTLKPSVFHMERNYGVSPGVTFLFAFDRKSNESLDKQIVIQDKLLGSGILKFKFLKTDFESIPDLIFPL